MKTLYIRLSDDAYAGFKDFCALSGVTVTSWVEAIGLLQHALDDDERLRRGRPSRNLLASHRTARHRRRGGRDGGVARTCFAPSGHAGG